MGIYQIDIVHFVRGMTWHDIGKPFALKTARHGALGYWLLQLAGFPNEALVALAHGHNVGNIKDAIKNARKIDDPDPKNVEKAKDGLNKLEEDALLRYFTKSGGEAVPALLLLSNALDRLSASVYSLQGRGGDLKTDRHSFQNPFSRLPEKRITDRTARFVISNLDEFERELWEYLRIHPPEKWEGKWSEVLTLAIKDKVEDKNFPIPTPHLLTTDEKIKQEIIEHLSAYMKRYPERTYPAVNDTSLTQHCRLSGILAFIAYRNIERQQGEWLKATVTFSQNGQPQGMPFSNTDVALRDHLEAYLVRIEFSGCRTLYERAVRVDDLHGARELTDRLQAAFKVSLADILKVKQLAEFLTISESQFDLIYLLPSPGDGQSLEKIVHEAYMNAVKVVAGAIINRLKRDFGQQINTYHNQMIQQLSNISYGLRVVPVGVPQGGKFNEMTAEYGRTLLKAYGKAMLYVLFPEYRLPTVDSTVESLCPEDTCEVCGNYPILVPSDDVSNENAKREWQRKRDFAAHIFRGEKEKVCLSCVARRTLAYGKIAKKMDPIVHPMLKKVGPGLWQRVLSDDPDALPPPPQLRASVQLDNEYALAEMGAFYVRYRRVAGQVNDDDVDIFPTTSYAADGDGNIVLLSLQPAGQELFATYAYDEAVEKFDPDKTQNGDLDEFEDLKLWRKTFVQFYKKVDGNPDTKNLAEPVIHIKPHLARVMERIQRIKQFYERLWTALTEEKIHILPLDLEYPTLRLLLPAKELDKALRVLDQTMTEFLFSATYADTAAKRRNRHKLLSQLIPGLLHGGVIIFKHKYSLYLALEAERDLFRQLKESEPDDDPNKRTRPNNGQWYGLRLAFSDLRGTLSEVAPMLAEVTYAELGTVIDLAQRIDRRTITGRANIINTVPLEQKARKELTRLADDLFTIRADRQGIKDDDVEALLAKNGKLFKPVHFIKTAMRE